jgi:CheY-like chemotaxis protein
MVATCVHPQQLLLIVENLLSRRGPTRTTILNVDDDTSQRYALSRILQQAGFTVLEACNGREALALASCKPNVVLLDVNLPDMLGFEVCRQLKANPQTKHIPVIQISATYSSEIAESKALSSGADRFIEHESEPLQIVQVVRETLAKLGQAAAD